MNKSIIFGAVGLVVGTVVGYFIGKAKVEKDCEEECQRVREQYKKKLEKVTEDASQHIREINNVTNQSLERMAEERLTKVPDKPSLNELMKKYRGEREEKEMRDPEYNDYDEVEGPPDEPSEDIDDYDEPTQEELEDEEARQAEMRERYMNSKPKLITYEDFENGLPGFDQKSLLYYQGNDTLTTDDDELVDDREALVGSCMEQYGYEDSEEKTIFVRNYKLETDYEIIKIFGDFVE